MNFVVVAKRLGDSVTFEVEAQSTKEGLAKARAEAYAVFGVTPGTGAGGPTVNVKPVADEE